ncbi:MAG TPA: flagellar hook capping FlgD N-terminal domain-containing protein [Solirubrobacteraceae bacterium]|jgi:flagellar basal-body rod modification protein FlgD|nr:flagellar hook capping FlgD N-terminal domain-containing protein [Solirubrobacteraceae bacterium]
MTPTPLASAASVSSPPSGSSSAENPNGVLGKDDFLKLMIAQLQAQNPLEPANGTEYVSELAQFTQVEQATNLATSSERTGAVQLIGHTVSYSDAAGVITTGKVQSVQTGPNGTTLTVEGVGGILQSSVVEVS